jgi:hypothetical protein
MDPAARKIIKALETRHRGTPARAVAERALELGYALVPPASRPGATYLRLIRKPPAGRRVTLYLDAAKLGSVAQDQRGFAESVAGAELRITEVLFSFGSADPFAVLAAFAAWSENPPQHPDLSGAPARTW